MRVAAIDDDVVFLNLLRRHLEREGFEVLTLANSIGTVTNRVRQFAPDVVLVDLAMPHLPGDALIQLMRREVPQAAYVVLSGCEPATLRQMESEAQADGAVAKSADLDELVHVIRSFEGWKRA